MRLLVSLALPELILRAVHMKGNALDPAPPTCSEDLRSRGVDPAVLENMIIQIQQTITVGFYCFFMGVSYGLIVLVCIHCEPLGELWKHIYQPFLISPLFPK